LGAGKGDKTRHGLVLQIAAAFEGKSALASSVDTLLTQTPPRSAVDVVVVIGHEKLTIEMQKLLGGYGVSVISAPKSSGVSSLS